VRGAVGAILVDMGGDSESGGYRRRMGVFSRHVSPSNEAVSIQNTSGVVPHASASGEASSYSKVHGKVSSENVQWVQIASVSGKHLEETLYKKSKGEGIAMVWIT